MKEECFDHKEKIQNSVKREGFNFVNNQGVLNSVKDESSYGKSHDILELTSDPKDSVVIGFETILADKNSLLNIPDGLKCNFCSFVTRHKSSLYKHKIGNHGDSKFKC